jgi:hypothetical protein
MLNRQKRFGLSQASRTKHTHTHHFVYAVCTNYIISYNSFMQASKRAIDRRRMLMIKTLDIEKKNENTFPTFIWFFILAQLLCGNLQSAILFLSISNKKSKVSCFCEWTARGKSRKLWMNACMHRLESLQIWVFCLSEKRQMTTSAIWFPYVTYPLDYE